MAWTVDDGWVWVLAAVDHYTAEAWAHVAKVGDRFAALQPIYDAVIDRHGVLAADVARGVEVRHDWGSQYRSRHFTGSLAWLGIADSPAYPGEPETNGCAERWIKTLQTAMPVGTDLPQHRRPAPRRRRVRRALQPRVADRTPRPPHTPRDLPPMACRQGGSRVIVNQPVQGTGSGSPGPVHRRRRHSNGPESRVWVSRSRHPRAAHANFARNDARRREKASPELGY